jgi:hypothetical protein
MPVPSEPFAAVYEEQNRLGVIVARTGRGGFEAYAADDHCLGLFPTRIPVLNRLAEEIVAV